MSITKYFSKIILTVVSILQFSCQAQPVEKPEVLVGAQQLEQILAKVQNKTVALLINHTSMINQTHLLDTLLDRGVNVKAIFAPEHGFRGNQSNGEKVVDGKDSKTGLPIISLYGKNYKPKANQLLGIDVVIYDIQDVGARFYTYISSMHYMMEACAENQIEFMILDRPNPNAHYVDGPVLKKAHASFVGVHTIPIVYGMTAGELAQMIQGERWINQSERLDLTIISLKNWSHDTPYSLPIQPSPNLPNDLAIQLYPSLCLFEGTQISVGRGTPHPFQVIGYPDEKFGTYRFIPESIPTASKYPKHEDKVCYGVDLRASNPTQGLNLSYLIKYYELSTDKEEFFNAFFTNLAGTDQLRAQIEKGLSEDEIKASWQTELDQFKEIRKKYLLYN